MGTKNRNRRIADFFCFTITLFVFCFPHTTLSCPSLSSKKHDNIDNKDNISISKSVVQGCPSLSSKKSRQHRQQRQHFYFQKVLSKVVPRCRQKKHDNIDNKDNISFLFQKCCPKLSFVVVKKNHLFMKMFIFVSENIKMFCLGNISLSLKSTIRFFLIRISPIQCVKERDGGLRSGSINDGLFHILMLGNVWVKSLTNLVQCATEQKMY